MKPNLPHLTAGALFLAAATRALCAVQTGGDGTDFFEKQVRPILIERCYDCHSAEAKIKGGLSLDTREGTLKGGDSGAVLAAGDPEKSLLIEAVRYKNHDLQMPPKKRLSDAEIRTLETWVKMGAPDPRTAPTVAKTGRVIDVAEGRKFWSFAPLSRAQRARKPPSTPLCRQSSASSAFPRPRRPTSARYCDGPPST